MNRSLNIGLSLAAGLLGGVLSHYVVAKPVLAQEETAPSKNIRAQTFTLVNNKGIPSGMFGFDSNGNAVIRLLAPSGKVIWSTQPLGVMHQLALNDSK